MVIESGRGLPLAFHFTPESDLSGQVVALGEDAGPARSWRACHLTFTPEWIDGARPGTARTPAYRTLGGFFPGVLAEYVVLPEQWLVASPARLDDVYACTLPCAGLTAWFALVERGGVSAGETVLIPGSGNVALFGLQIAKAHGAEVIISSSAAKLDLVRAVDRTGIVPVVDARYRLADLPAALNHLDRGPFGKIVVEMTD